MCQEAEKKKPMLNPFNEDATCNNWIEPRPASYALSKISNLEYVKLDYFTIKGCKEATADTNSLVSYNTSPSCSLKTPSPSTPWLASGPPRTFTATRSSAGWKCSRPRTTCCTSWQNLGSGQRTTLDCWPSSMPI